MVMISVLRDNDESGNAEFLTAHMQTTALLGSAIILLLAALHVILSRKSSRIAPASTLTKMIPNHNSNAKLEELLLDACFACDHEEILQLLHAGANANATTKHFEDGTILIVSQACRYLELIGHKHDVFKMIEDLIQFGADVNAQNFHGHTALSQAASRGDEDMIRFLLRKGANPRTKNCLGASPRRVAHVHGHEQVARMLEY